jgi:enoyl-CoA hydratase
MDYASFTALKLNLLDGIMTVTLSNPGKKNAITSAMSNELNRIWDELLLDPNVKVIILTGDGSDFCAGANLGALSERAATKQPDNPVHPTTRNARKHAYSILDCEKPILAKVRGVAYGLGVTLALACDIVFASEEARFCDSHVKAGMVAGDGGVLLWPPAVGIHRAKEYLMTGDPVPARVAEQIGLINYCVPDSELDDRVLAFARKLMALPPHAVNYTKMSLNAALRNMTGSAFETSVAYEIYSMGMADFAEATKAFVEKRNGRFFGR